MMSFKLNSKKKDQKIQKIQNGFVIKNDFYLKVTTEKVLGENHINHI